MGVYLLSNDYFPSKSIFDENWNKSVNTHKNCVNLNNDLAKHNVTKVLFQSKLAPHFINIAYSRGYNGFKNIKTEEITVIVADSNYYENASEKIAFTSLLRTKRNVKNYGDLKVYF